MRRLTSDQLADAVWWHKPLRACLGVLITELARTRFHVELHGAQHLRDAGGALILSNHRCDSDGPILSGILLQRRGVRFHGVEPYFVAREDLFRRGFLGDYLDNWPRALRAVLGELSVGPVLWAMRLRPMRRIPEHSLRELLADVIAVLGDVPLRDVLRDDWVARLAHAAACSPDDLRVARALETGGEILRQRHAFRKLTLEAFRRLKPFEREVIDGQLRAFVELLERGAALLLTPEGTVSADGRLRGPRGAVHHLINAPARAPRVLPVALSYDCMRLGKPRVLVRFGPVRRDLRGLSRRDTTAATQRVLLEQWMINISHLAAHYLRRVAATPAEGQDREELTSFVAAVAGRCQSRGIPVDPALLDPVARTERTGECFEFWRRRRHQRAGNLLRYLNNELDCIAAIHPGLLCHAHD